MLLSVLELMSSRQLLAENAHHKSGNSALMWSDSTHCLRLFHKSKNFQPVPLPILDTSNTNRLMCACGCLPRNIRSIKGSKFGCLINDYNIFSFRLTWCWLGYRTTMAVLLINEIYFEFYDYSHDSMQFNI